MERKQQHATCTKKEAYQKLSTLCAMSELCQHDVQRKMQRWGMSPEDIREVTVRLVEERFVDEERFARAFVRDKFRYNHWGPVRIVEELRMRHIAPTQIEAGMAELADLDCLSTLREIIAKKRPGVKGRNAYEVKAKLIRFALGRGFKMEDIMKVVGQPDDFDEV